MNGSTIALYIVIFGAAFAITVFAERLIIPRLKRIAAQPIYAEGPGWHLSKSGTPTMGGIGFIIAFIISCGIALLFMTKISDSYAVLSLLLNTSFAAANALIGLIDDVAKIKKHENAGLSPLQKLSMQAIISTLYILLRQSLLGEGTEIIFKSERVDIGLIYYPLAIIMLLGTINCANLTDGIDGIASGVAFSSAAAFAAIFSDVSYEVGFIAFAIMGASLGFLCFNVHPAKIFMGDTGSLFLGAILASVCFSLRNPLIILFFGGVYLLEGLSVIIQVAVYKMTRRRVFKMAPFHHHLEKCGWSENKIVIAAMILTTVLAVISRFIFV
jgi:phospho-N-acetylmuramoyl-pentapeptide-transferase